MSFQDHLLVMILAVLVGIFFISLFHLFSSRRRDEMTGEFLKRFGSALQETAGKMDSGGLDQPVMESLATLGQAANALAKKASNMLVAKGLNDQASMLVQAEKEIEVPPPPSDDLKEVPAPEQLQHTPAPESPGPTEPKASLETPSGEGSKAISITFGMEEARQVIRSMSMLNDTLRANGVNPDETFTLEEPPCLLGKLIQKLETRAMGNVPRHQNEVLLLEFLQGLAQNQKK